VLWTRVSDVDDPSGHWMGPTPVKTAGVHWMNEINALTNCIQLHDLETHDVIDASNVG
jgi:hypothetical protein